MTTAARVHGNKAVSATLRGRRGVAVLADGASVADMVAAMRAGLTL